MKIFNLFLILLTAVPGLISAQDVHHCKKGNPGPNMAKTLAASGDSIDVLHYDIRLNILNLQQKELSGFTEISFVPEYPGMQIFTFDLEQLSVDSVQLNQNLVSHSYNSSILNVLPAQTFGPADTVRVRVYYHGNPVTDPGGFGGFTFTTDTLFAFNLGVGMTVDPHNFGRCWYPCKDNFTERAVYDFHIRVSNPKTAVCNGTLISDTDNMDGTHTLHWKLNHDIPTYLSAVAVSNYIAHRDTIQAALGPVPVSLYVNPSDSLNAVNSFIRLDTTVKMFEQYFGPYRWERVGYVSVPFNGGAMEHATSISYPRVTINGTNTYEWLFAHELAHSWFGNLVTCETAGDMWLNEGFAAWTEGFFYEKLNSVPEGRAYARQNHRMALQFASVLDGGFYPVSGIPHAITYGSTVYDLGASVVQSLRHYMGDALFFPAIRDYMDTYKFRHASSDSMRIFLEQHSGIPLTDFFQNWVYNAGVPHYRIDSTQVSPDGSGGFNIDIWLRQQRYGGSFSGQSSKVDVHFYDASWGSQVQTVSFSGATHHASFSLPYSPSAILLDPEEKCLDAVTDEVRVIKTTGVSAFPQMFCSLDAQFVQDSALVQVAHHWVAPDAETDPADAPLIFGKRFWKIDGIIPMSLSAKMTFIYDGRTTNTASNSNHFLDDALITYTEDSLILVYRQGPGHYWKEVSSYTRNTGNVNDKAGTFVADMLVPGEYAVAMKQIGNHTPEDKVSPSPLLQAYPNPAEDKLEIQFLLGTDKTAQLSLTDLQGRILRTVKVYDYQTTLQWDVRGIPSGIYWLRLDAENGNAEVLKVQVR